MSEIELKDFLREQLQKSIEESNKWYNRCKRLEKLNKKLQFKIQYLDSQLANAEADIIDLEYENSLSKRGYDEGNNN
jgi:hypothetical protein